MQLPKEIEARVTQAVESTRTQLKELKPSEDLLPIAHIYGEKIIVMGFIFRNQIEKELSVQAISKTARTVQADLIVTRIESWTVKLADGEMEQFNKERAQGMWKSLGEHPKAAEIVMFLADTKENTWTGVCQILKTEGGRQLGDITWTDQAAGLFTGLLRELH